MQAVEDAVRREKAQAAASVSQARAADQARRRQLELEKATIAGVAVGVRAVKQPWAFVGTRVRDRSRVRNCCALVPRWRSCSRSLVQDVDARTVEVGEDVDPATGVSVNKLGGLTLDQGGAHSGMAFQQSEQPRLVSGAKKLVFRPKPLLRWVVCAFCLGHCFRPSTCAHMAIRVLSLDDHRTTDVDMSELCASPGVDVIRWEAELEQSLLLVGTL